MSDLEVERVGGLGAFGSARSRLRSRGKCVLASLSQADRDRLESLFRKVRGKPRPPAPDMFTYRLTRRTASGTETVEVPEDQVPAAVAGCVKDELL